MIERLDKSRLVLINLCTTFSKTPSVSQRLKALYNSCERMKEIKAIPLPTSVDLPVEQVQIVHKPHNRYGDEESHDAVEYFFENATKPSKPYKSIHVLRMQWGDMPNVGWLVNAVTRTCSCRFNFKFGICVHVIKSTQILALPGPGMRDPIARFVSNQRCRGSNMIQRQRRRSLRQRNLPLLILAIRYTRPPSLCLGHSLRHPYLIFTIARLGHVCPTKSHLQSLLIIKH
ncbi:hypothetical protein PHMEG_0008686 [Phytophthora megakarya]|uniref:SWIM-type domain-containing protein n=1 Tax=Phytophthora megakarya TaxID=4795 RepID=A0A225WJF2_9STRA|nr:hypothetical protein PHMEG_0008686 [Phytophthora megakarya]